MGQCPVRIASSETQAAVTTPVDTSRKSPHPAISSSISRLSSTNANIPLTPGYLRFEGIRQLATLLQQQNRKLDTVLERISALEQSQRGHRVEPKVNYVRSPVAEPLPLFQSSTSAYFPIRVVDAYLKGTGHSTTAPELLEETDNSDTRVGCFSILHGEIVDDVAGDIANDQAEDLTNGPCSRTPSDGFSDPPIHPLDTLDCEEILRLVFKYEDLAGMMYPIVQVSYIAQRVRDVWSLDASVINDNCKCARLHHSDLATLHIIVAIGSAVDDDNGSDLVRSLHKNLWPDIEPMVWNARIDLKGLIILTLMALFHYYANNWRLSWRLLGNVARLVLELGLNREIVLDRSFPDKVMRSQAVNTIWTVFVLDQQISYALGLTTATRDLYLRLDPCFPKPIKAPYLEGMVKYAQIGAQAVSSLVNQSHSHQTVSSSSQEVLSYFQYRLDEWCKMIETDFLFPPASERTDMWNQRLRTVFRLRANNLRIVVSRCLLLGKDVQNSAPADIWDSSVQVAANIGELLAAMDSLPTTCGFEKSRSNYFLITALGLLLLVISSNRSHLDSPSVVKRPPPMAPATYLKAQSTAKACLNLLHDRAESSRQARCLWERICVLGSRFDLLESPIPASWHETRLTPSVDDLLTGRQAQLVTDQERGSLDSLIGLNFASMEELIMGSASSVNIFSEQDMVYDPGFLSTPF
ncbi:hypothetical protein F5Y10DRAFT_285913 [Nemania abortiva]|nr:hypothetical protein F5Y10DRAFT_285913 [Nemania abortiva]